MYSIENLYHFNCSKCNKWFSIGDYNKDSLELYCPLCENKENHKLKKKNNFIQKPYEYYCIKCYEKNSFGYELDLKKDLIHCCHCNNEATACLKEDLFKVGDKVEKFTGDYKVTGTVVSVFNKLSKEIRVVLECDEPKGLLLIFNTEQIRLCTG